MTPEAPMAQRAHACPDPEQLAAYIDGGLPAEERALVERHLVDCPECRDIIGGSVESLDEIGEDLARQQHQGAGAQPASVPFPSPSSSKPSRAKWFYTAAGALAAAGAVVLAVRLPRHADPIADLRNAARGTSRTVEARMTGGFSYEPLAGATRGTAPSAIPPELQIAAARLDQRVAADPTAANLHAAGAAQLLLGNHDVAIMRLEEASRKGPGPSIASDLAAAYLTRGQRENRPDDFVRALNEVEAALRGDSSVESLFNRALVLEALNLRQQAREAWRAYLAADGTSEWANEARRHLQVLESQRRPGNTIVSG